MKGKEDDVDFLVILVSAELSPLIRGRVEDILGIPEYVELLCGESLELPPFPPLECMELGEEDSDLEVGKGERRRW